MASRSEAGRREKTLPGSEEGDGPRLTLKIKI